MQSLSSELEDCISGSETTEQSIELKLLAEAINTYLYTLPGSTKRFLSADTTLRILSEKSQTTTA